MNANAELILKVWDGMRKEHVTVSADKLRADSYAAVAAGEKFELPSWQIPGIYPASHAAFPSYVFWHDVVNFCYNHPVKLEDGSLLKFQAKDSSGKKQSGAFAMSACFYRAFGERPILASDMFPYVKSLSATKAFFAGYTNMPLVGERYDMLYDAARKLERHYAGDPMNIFEAARYRAHSTRRDGAWQPGVIEILEDIFQYSFMDIGCLYSEGGSPTRLPTRFNFQKRANLVVVEYNGRAVVSGGELTPIKDMETVGPVPDYELPKSYEADGIFSYSPELYAKIDGAKPIAQGSRMELEIRMATVWAQYQELKWINEARYEHMRSGATFMQPLHIGHVDFYRWYRGKKSTKRPPHICFTTNY